MSSLNQSNNPYFNKGEHKKSPHVLDLRKIVDNEPQEQENQEMFKLDQAKRFSIVKILKKLSAYYNKFFNCQLKKASRIKDSYQDTLKKKKKHINQKKKLAKNRFLSTARKTKKALHYIERVGEKVEKDFIEKTDIGLSFDELQVSSKQNKKDKGDLFIFNFRKNVKVLHGVDIKETLDELVIISVIKLFGVFIYGIGKITYRSFVYVFVFVVLVFRAFVYFFEYLFITIGLQNFFRTKLPFVYSLKARLKLFCRSFKKIKFAKPKLLSKKSLRPAIIDKDFKIKADIGISQTGSLKEVSKKHKKYHFSFFNILTWHGTKKVLRPILSFAVVALVFIMPLRFLDYYRDLQDTKGRVMGISEVAYGHLKSAGRATMVYDLAGAQSEFAAASENFDKARDELNQTNIVLQKLVKLIPQKGQMFTSAQNLIEAGGIISQIGAQAGQSIENLLSRTVKSENINHKLKIIKADLENIRPQVNKATDFLNGVNEKFIPAGERETFIKTRNQFILFNESLNRFSELSDIWLNILGEEHKKRYLIVFQNNNEIRPTGGFMGSFALVDIFQGDIRKIEIPGGGPYDFKGSLLARVKAPDPFHLLSSRWQFQDANWFPDFPESAKKIMWFYEKSGGSTVDGVITLNASLFSRLLKITGSIEMEDYGKIIDADNFIVETQKAVEIEYDKEENKPKKFIADLTPIMLERLLNSKSEHFVDIMSVFIDAAKKKDILCYFNDKEIEENIIELGWGGEIKDTPSDYLAVINTNIAGGKTDGVIKQDIKHEVEVQNDGTAIASVIITRTHNGQAGDLFTGDRNINYTRVYVPKGSILLEAGGFDKPKEEFFKPEMDNLEDDYDLRRIERQARFDPATGVRISEQFDKTVFGHWTQVYPGKSATLTFKYKLPFKIENKSKEVEPTGIFAKPILREIYKKFFSPDSFYLSYSLLLQKQPGRAGDSFSGNIIYPEKWKEVWMSSVNMSKDKKSISIYGDMDQDRSYGVIWKR